MSIFNKKYRLDPLHTKSAEFDRRKFIIKSLAGILGVTVLANAEELLAVKSKTGFIYVKQDGEIINDYKPSAGLDPYLSEIGLFSFNYAPTGWAQCSGQLLPLNQNIALYALLGIMYGGDGINTFALPDLRGRAPIHFDNDNSYFQGTKLGAEAVTLSASQMPEHNHALNGNSGVGVTSSPDNNYIAKYAEGVNTFSGSANASLNAGALSNSGGSQAHNNMQPYLTLNYCIALQGIFPSET